MGGHKIVYEYANRLSRKGHLVTICFYPIDSLAGTPIPESLKWAARKQLVRQRPTWFTIDAEVRKLCIREISDDEIPDADIVFATEIATAFPVAALSKTKGTKFYLIQDFENWSRPDNVVLNSYRLGMRNVAVSRWLAELVESTAQVKCVCIPNPVDTRVFNEDSTIVRTPFSVAVMYHIAKHKGFEYAWRAIERAKDIYPALTVNMFGAYRRPTELPNWVSYTQNADDAQLKTIYSSSSAYVCASIEEGFGLTCVEAMACGCALVVSDFQGSREYAKNGWNALVSPVRNEAALSKDIVKVLGDANLRVELASNGILTACERSWEMAVSALEKEMHLS